MNEPLADSTTAADSSNDTYQNGEKTTIAGDASGDGLAASLEAGASPDNENDLADAQVVEESEATAAHSTSMAVWDVPDPVESQSVFTVRVGAKCSNGCSIARTLVSIFDAGRQLGSGYLGEAVFSDKLDLYWADIEVVAPVEAGHYQWEAVLSASEAESAASGEAAAVHLQATARFNVNVALAAEHSLTVTIVGQDTQEAPGRTRVILLPYRGYANENGVYTAKVAAGTYELLLVADRYDDFRATIDITGETEFRAELVPSDYETDYRGNVFRIDKETGERIG
ncbi:MAG: hypothetical protein FWH40_09250 [Coriobacteriia bacterium]|nr:hypothetical protein [Coriobacteriia bacterium]